MFACVADRSLYLPPQHIRSKSTHARRTRQEHVCLPEICHENMSVGVNGSA